MRKFSLLVFLCFCLQLHAEDFKILQMNTSSIKIGTAQCKPGDVFSDEDEIFWTNEKQAMKAMNLKTRETRLFVAKEFSRARATNVKDFFLKENHLSSRDGIYSFTSLAEKLQETVYLYDIVSINSPVELDSLSSYVVSYGGGQKKWCTLMSTRKTFYLSRELFSEVSDETEFILTLYFRRKNQPKDYLITSDLHVVLLPLQLDE